MSEILCTFTPNKSYAYLLNVEPSNLMFLRTYNTEFDKIIITFTDQNGRPLGIEDKVNLKLLINKYKWCDKEQGNMLKGKDFIISKKYKKQLLDND